MAEPLPGYAPPSGRGNLDGVPEEDFSGETKGPQDKVLSDDKRDSRDEQRKVPKPFANYSAPKRLFLLELIAFFILSIVLWSRPSSGRGPSVIVKTSSRSYYGLLSTGIESPPLTNADKLHAGSCSGSSCGSFMQGKSLPLSAYGQSA